MQKHTGLIGSFELGLYPRVFVEPADGALPGQVGRGLVVALGRGVAIEAVNGAGLDTVFVRSVYRR